MKLTHISAFLAERRGKRLNWKKVKRVRVLAIHQLKLEKKSQKNPIRRNCFDDFIYKQQFFIITYDYFLIKLAFKF